MGGVLPSSEFNEQLKRAVRETMRRQRPNVGGAGRWHKKGGNSSVHIMAFEIVTADCEAGSVTTNASAIARFTSCGDPPGADDTGVYVIQDYFGFISTLTEAELIGSRALAIYWYDWTQCIRQWDLLMVEYTTECA